MNFDSIKNSIAKLTKRPAGRAPINWLSGLRFIYPITILIILIILFAVGWFLYNNVYKTIAYAEELTDLKKQVPENVLENNKFKTITEKIEAKTKLDDINIDAIRNIFEGPPLPIAPETAKETKK